MIAKDLRVGDTFTFPDVDGVFVVLQRTGDVETFPSIYGAALVILSPDTATAYEPFTVTPIHEGWEVHLISRDHKYHATLSR